MARTPPTATLSATNSAADNQRECPASTALNLPLTNNGGTPLNLTSITISGAQAADFAFAAGNTCPTGAGSVAPGASCTISISFTPAATGARTATVTITDDAASSPQSVSLAGMGIAPAVTLAPTNLAFGDQRLSTTSPVQTVTLTNSGTATLSITSITLAGLNPGDFAIAAGTTCTNGATVVAGASCLLNLTFTPTAASARTATVTITDDAAGSPQAVSLTATGVTPPTATLSATSSAFGNQRVGTTSAAQNLTLTNNGGTPLNLTSITITGAQAADFAFAAGNTCPTGAGSVAPGASCTISISFTPAATGARTATVTITDDAAGSPQLVSLAGTGIVPAVTLAPTNLAFGTQRLSTTSPAQTVTLTNSGTATLSITSIALAGSNPGDFAVAGSGVAPCPLAGGPVAASASCAFTVTFTPAATGGRAATVTITDDAAGSPQSVSLTGTGVTPPTATLSATSSVFGNQRVGTTSAAQNLTLTNNGGTPLNLTSITITGAQAADFAFAAGNTCPTGAGSVAPGASCTISISNAPAATDARTPTLPIAVHASGSPQSVSLAGMGIAPAVTLAPTNLAFGDQRLSTTSPARSEALTTDLQALAYITCLLLPGSNPGDFAVAGSGVAPCPLAGGPVAASASCAFTVTFTPAATGARTATVTITDDAPGSPQSVSLTGTGVTPPTATLSATSSAFGNQRVGTTSAAQNLTLTNNGGTPLNLTSITITGAQAADFAFAAANTCPTGAGSVAPGASCTISISFTPAAASARTATVTITDDAPGSPQSVSLAGTGIVPAVTLAPTNLAFDAQRLSTTSPAQTVTLTNSGTATLSITSIALAGSNPGDFAIAAGTTCTNGATVVAGASCLLNLTFTPTAASARTATVTITDDAAGSPQSVSLTGTGVTLRPQPLAAHSAISAWASPPTDITFEKKFPEQFQMTADLFIVGDGTLVAPSIVDVFHQSEHVLAHGLVLLVDRTPVVRLSVHLGFADASDGALILE